MNRVFYFNLTYRCQYRCRYCFSHTTSDDLRRPDISLARFQECLKANRVNDRDRIVLNGGEPTTHPEFLEILESAVSSRADVVLYTNGAAYSEDGFLSDALSVGRYRITIPIHGGEELHDYVTCRPGSWKAACVAMRNIANADGAARLEPKFIVSDRLSKSRFDILQFVDEQIHTWAAVKDIVIAGQVNTKTAYKNRAVATDWNEIMCFAEREIVRCSKRCRVKFYDLPLCRSSEEFKLFVGRCETGEINAVEIYFIDGVDGPRIVRLPSDNRFPSCKDCVMRGVCTSIVSDYTVSMVDGKDVIRIME